MKTGTIEQFISFNAAPEVVYDLIMDAEKHSEFTGSDVEMSQEIDGKFKVFDGYCHGYNIELERGKKIVQAWHFAEEGWPENHFSICTFLFEPEDGGTKMTFIQTGVPEKNLGALEEGWLEYYWGPMSEFIDD